MIGMLFTLCVRVQNANKTWQQRNPLGFTIRIQLLHFLVYEDKPL